MKGYRLWYTDRKSSKFVISRDVTFDENYMLQSRKESVVDSTGSGEETNKQVKLESKVTERVQESTHWLEESYRRSAREHTLNQSMMLRVQLR